MKKYEIRLNYVKTRSHLCSHKGIIGIDIILDAALAALAKNCKKICVYSEQCERKFGGIDAVKAESEITYSEQCERKFEGVPFRGSSRNYYNCHNTHQRQPESCLWIQSRDHYAIITDDSVRSRCGFNRRQIHQE